jgi:hypothetical protein
MKNTRARRPIILRRTVKRRGGGSSETKMAVMTYVRNIASQILNSIELKDENLGKNVKYFQHRSSQTQSVDDLC